jgi:hypothetical protein
VAETFADRTAIEPAGSAGLVCDAPADADVVLASIPISPRWIGLTLAFGVSGLMWAAIVLGARWAFGTMS